MKTKMTHETEMNELINNETKFRFTRKTLKQIMKKTRNLPENEKLKEIRSVMKPFVISCGTGNLDFLTIMAVLISIKNEDDRFYLVTAFGECMWDIVKDGTPKE